MIYNGIAFESARRHRAVAWWLLACALLLCSGTLAPSFAQAPQKTGRELWCKADAKYGGVTLINPQAAAGVNEKGMMAKSFANGAFNNDKDELLIQLYAGSGPFAKGIVPGTYTLGKGDDAKYETCGACVLMYADTRDFSQGEIYFAKSGTLTIEAVDVPGGKGRFKARVDRVVLTHIRYDFKSHVSKPGLDGCSIEISSASMDVPMYSFNCPFPPGGGDIVVTTGSAVQTRAGGKLDSVTVSADLNKDPDRLELRLRSGRGVFAGDILPGRYELGTGIEASLATCSLCVLLLTDGASGESDPKKVYFARKGTLLIDSNGAPGGGNFNAKLTNLVMEHVTVDPKTRKETTVGDGCVTRIATIDMKIPVK